MSKYSRKTKLWAIKLNYPERAALAGVLFWFEPPTHCAGERTALFSTRDKAKAAKRKVFGPGLHQVVRVLVTVEEI